MGATPAGGSLGIVMGKPKVGLSKASTVKAGRQPGIAEGVQIENRLTSEAARGDQASIGASLLTESPADLAARASVVTHAIDAEGSGELQASAIENISLDIFKQPNVKTVIVAHNRGINDPDAQDILEPRDKEGEKKLKEGVTEQALKNYVNSIAQKLDDNKKEAVSLFTEANGQQRAKTSLEKQFGDKTQDVIKSWKTIIQMVAIEANTGSLSVDRDS